MLMLRRYFIVSTKGTKWDHLLRDSFTDHYIPSKQWNLLLQKCLIYLIVYLVKTHRPFLTFKCLNSNNIVTHAVNVIVGPQVGWC